MTVKLTAQPHPVKNKYCGTLEVTSEHFRFTIKIPQEIPCGETWEVVEVDDTPLSAYKGVVSIRYGRADAKTWEQHSLVKEYDFTPIPATTPILLPIGASRHAFKFGDEARGVYAAAIFYCQNLAVTWQQAAAMGLLVITSTSHKKKGKWSYNVNEFVLAAGWMYEKIYIASGERIDLSMAEKGILEYLKLPQFLENCFGDFCLAEGGQFHETYLQALKITAAASGLDDNGEETVSETSVVEIDVSSRRNVFLLLENGEVWCYLYNTLPDFIEVLRRDGNYFTLAVKGKYSLIKGAKYNRFDESDCLYNRGYRFDNYWQQQQTTNS